MAYSQTDLDNVQTALVLLATGKRAVRVTVGGKTLEFANPDISKLRQLLSEIKADVAAAAGGSQYYLTSTSKGL